MVYKLLKRIIQKKNYESLEEIKEKIAVFNLQGSITNEQRDELYAMLEEVEK